MSTINKVILIGRVGADPHTFQFSNGGIKAEISLATNETFVRKDTGEKIETTEWHKVIMNNKPAEIVEKYVKKGDLMYIEGRIQTRKWTDSSGVDRYTTEIICKEFRFLTPKGSTNDQPVAQSQPRQTANEQHAGDEFLNMTSQDDTDDLPF